MFTDIIYNKLIFTHMRMFVLSNEDKILKTLFVYEQEFFYSYEKGAHSIVPQKKVSLSGERSASL